MVKFKDSSGPGNYLYLPKTRKKETVRERKKEERNGRKEKKEGKGGREEERKKWTQNHNLIFKISSHKHVRTSNELKSFLNQKSTGANVSDRSPQIGKRKTWECSHLS